MSDSDASTPRAWRDASKPEVLPIGPYPPWDVESTEREYELRRPWEAPDRDAFFAEVAAGVRAVATRGELGADAAGVRYAHHPDAVALAAASDILVNVARGSSVDEGAPIAALESGALAGAALDLFRNEPNVDPRLLSFADVVARRRQSRGAIETRKAMGKLVRDNLAAHFAGRPLPMPVV